MIARNLVLILCIGLVVCQEATDPFASLSSLPPELQDKIDANQTDIIVSKVKGAFKDKCDRNAGPDVFNQAWLAQQDLPNCVNESLKIASMEALMKEVNDAKPHGNVDEVCKKYCAKSPEIKKCLFKVFDSYLPCFTDEEKENIKVLRNITEQLTEFICFKEGDRIALFVAEGGLECLEANKNQFSSCFNQTFVQSQQIDINNITADAIPEVKFGQEECEKIIALQKCVVKSMESCKTPTSANIFEALFKFAREATPCKLETVEVHANARTNKNSTSPGSASGIAVTSATLIFAYISTLLI